MKEPKGEKTNERRLRETGELLNKHNKIHSDLKKGSSKVAEFIHSAVSLQAESGAVLRAGK